MMLCVIPSLLSASPSLILRAEKILGLRKDEVLTVDFNTVVHPSIVHDASLRLPWVDEFFGSVFLMNCLHVFPDPLAIIKEACRILQPDGVVVMSFPLIFPYTPEPRDFGRFTEDGIRFLCSRAGLTVTCITPIGGRWTSAAYLINPFSGLCAVFALPLYFTAFTFDALYSFLLPALSPAPIGYFVIARKL